MILRTLEWRGIPVPDSVRERVEECTDLARLETWAQRALRVTEPTELFTDE